ncbi:ectonucleotide pyrophosphatase/phosphodiesterase family member 5-like isoform X2 [Daktulosphaira vitifoliae]|uniref:ectonucleotide pyrophosphatase/phosphodiesterase family member 5-like isoform X2 n=1 Tax=Daktulosphaira vitifoliae TaxID=58002 RepID=UPI0021AAD3A5|nr:ectonucleotide pyrophosphatase/phosphodiesterase family member 5-like isoform X2 [Daktulosphaira vitifoliae]
MLLKMNTIYAILPLAFATAVTALTKHPLVMIVSFDAFRPDYINPKTTPHLAMFKKSGVSVPYMKSVFPTKTFVNHFSIATGLYAETHGILDNYMFDSKFKYMHCSEEQFHYNNRVVPLWLENEFNGDERYSGVMMWPGSEFSYLGKKPTYIGQYNKSLKWTERVDKMMTWIKNDKRPSNLIFAYFEEPDFLGHYYGIHTGEMKEQIVRVDAAVNDHGMESVKYKDLIYLENYLDTTKFTNISSGTNVFIHPNPNTYDEVYKNLTALAKKLGNFNVYTRKNMLERWHVSKNERWNELIYLLAAPGYAFKDKWILEYFDGRNLSTAEIGVHGYDNLEPSMFATFMARGPAFKSNYSIEPFENINIFPLVSYILNIKQTGDHVRTNGSLNNVENLLAKNHGTSMLFYNNILLVAVTALVHIVRVKHC